MRGRGAAHDARAQRECAAGTPHRVSSWDYPSPRVALYSATKAAVEALTISLSREWGARGIRVNAVAPGQTSTDMLLANNPPERLRASVERIALGRLGQPEDIADVVAFLASDDARWITGETIHVNGGQRT